MIRGDISNETPSRVYVAFEGTIANPKDSWTKTLLQRKPRLKDYAIDPEVTALLWDNWQRYGVRFDAFTFAFQADEVQAWIDSTNLPIHTTWDFANSNALAMLLPSMPWVSHVVDHMHPMSYGGRGTTLPAVARG